MWQIREDNIGKKGITCPFLNFYTKKLLFYVNVCYNILANLCQMAERIEKIAGKQEKQDISS